MNALRFPLFSSILTFLLHSDIRPPAIPVAWSHYTYWVFIMSWVQQLVEGWDTAPLPLPLPSYTSAAVLLSIISSEFFFFLKQSLELLVMAQAVSVFVLNLRQAGFSMVVSISTLADCPAMSFVHRLYVDIQIEIQMQISWVGHTLINTPSPTCTPSQSPW